MNATTRTTAWSACLLLPFTAATHTRADIVTLDMPDLVGLVQQSQPMLEAFVDFGVDFRPLYRITIEITATGVPGQDATGAVPASLVVSAFEIVTDVIGGPWLSPTSFGPFGSTPTTDSATQTPLVGDDAPIVYSGYGYVTIEAPPVGAGLVTAAQIQILSATITAEFDPTSQGCTPGDIGCDGFIGLADLNIILGAWNQNVPPADPLADISGDGYVGIEDLNLVLGNWNAGTPPSGNAVPEPGTFALLGLMGLLPLRRCRLR